MEHNKKNKTRILIGFCCVSLVISTFASAAQVSDHSTHVTNIETHSTIIVPDDYSTITDALSHATNGDTIFVKAGTYKENIVIDKMVFLKGEAWEHVILDGDQKDHVISIQTSGVSISGFTISNSASNCAGIDIKNNHYNIITMNIIQSNFYGISLYSSNGNNINDNIIKNNVYGIKTDASHANIIADNELSNNELNGLYFDFTSTFNQATWNIVDENGLAKNAVFYDSSLAGGIVLDSACRSNSIISNEVASNQIGVNSDNYNENNILYLNSFMENVQSNAMDTANNTWNGGTMGNYWSDYTGIDANGDGIGDIPYLIPGGDNSDAFPLVDPINPEPPHIEAPSEWDYRNGEASFAFYSLDPNYDQVHFEIKWGDSSNEYLTDELKASEGITLLYSYDTELRYTVWARTMVEIGTTGDIVKSDYARHVITWSHKKDVSESANKIVNTPSYLSTLLQKCVDMTSKIPDEDPFCISNEYSSPMRSEVSPILTESTRHLCREGSTTTWLLRHLLFVFRDAGGLPTYVQDI